MAPRNNTRQTPATPPMVSVIMANHNGAPFIGDAIASVLCQSLGELEVIVSDDASSDDSADIVSRIAARDPRVRLLQSKTRGGPSQARNRALAAARGTWIGIVDSDDLIHPLRTARMLEQAETLGVDVIADDLIYFGANLGKTLLGDFGFQTPWLPSNADFLEAEMANPPIPVGYLKPLIRKSAIGTLCYRSYMTIGEDFDFLLRVLMGGARIAVLPEAYYLYRRHASSISHRLGTADIEAMLRAGAELEGDLPPELHPLLEKRQKALNAQMEFARLVETLKSPRCWAGARMLAASPRLAHPLFMAFREHLSRRGKFQKSSPGMSHLSLAEQAGGDPPPYRLLEVPGDPSNWTPARAAAVAARTGCGPVRLRAHGRAGLDALGYVPGWETAALISPKSGWTTQERHRIAALPWPVSLI